MSRDQDDIYPLIRTRAPGRASLPAGGVEVVILDGPGRERTLRALTAAASATPWRVRVASHWAGLAPARAAEGGPGEEAPTDVVLLRAGVEVYHDWLDRLREAAYADPATATATPFSPGGPLAAYPRPGSAPVAADEGPSLDASAARVNRAQRLRLPAPGGCCVYLRGDCLGDVRAESGGLAAHPRHVLAADVFVYGDVGAAAPLWSEPTWGAAFVANAVASHLRADPARPLRRNLDLERLAGPGPAVLMVTHWGGGGTEKHVRDMAGRLEAEGVRVAVLRPAAGVLRLERFTVSGTPDLFFNPSLEYYSLLHALRRLGCAHVHVHHLLGHPPETRRLVAELGLPYDLTIHDYLYVCPRIFLQDHASRYCGEPAPAACNTCLARNGDFEGVRSGIDITAWRRRHAPLLTGARRVFVPHAEVGRRLRRYFPDVEVTERPHPEGPWPARPAPPRPVPGEPLRVGLLGYLAAHKGLDLVIGCARDTAARRLPLFFQLIGVPIGADFAALGNAAATGEYREEDVFDLIDAHRLHCALFLSLVPESYSYTLSIAQAARLYAVGLDLGAIGARIRESGWGEVLPLHSTPAAINDRLLAVGRRLAVGAEPPPPPRHGVYENMLRDYYGLAAGDGASVARHIAATPAALPKARTPRAA